MDMADPLTGTVLIYEHVALLLTKASKIHNAPAADFPRRLVDQEEEEQAQAGALHFDEPPIVMVWRQPSKCKSLFCLGS